GVALVLADGDAAPDHENRAGCWFSRDPQAYRADPSLATALTPNEEEHAFESGKIRHDHPRHTHPSAIGSLPGPQRRHDLPGRRVSPRPQGFLHRSAEILAPE